MRVQKYLSEQGILSRREAERFIKEGKIFINGKKAILGVKIDPLKDKVEVKGISDTSNQKESVIIYKPRGIVSGKNNKEGKTIYELFPQYSHLHITGRLDKESEGLLLLTNDGVLAKKITSDEHLVEKEYKVRVREKVSNNELRFMERGIKLKDGITLPAKTERVGEREFLLIIKEGRNHQIRRMADNLHLTVERLIRIRIGPITVKGLKEGFSRPLRKEEISAIKLL